MCRIPYEKCVCFVFLVVLAVLSCSGFRIDNLAMTDISKRNSHTSSSLLNSDEFFDRLFSVNATLRHRIRHHRRPHRALFPTPQPNEHFAQIPATDPHTPLPTRSIRSSNQKKNRRHFCPEHDVSWKAYKANVIVIAKVESHRCFPKSKNCTINYKVIETLKKNSSFSLDDSFQMKFSTDKGSTNCEYDGLDHRSHFLVRNRITDQSKMYILFLNIYDFHNFSAVFAPEPVKRKTHNVGVIRKVISPNFKPKALKLESSPPQKVGKGAKRLKLTCKVKGFPIPIIYWKRNSILLHPNSRQRITQKSDGKDRRKSTLVIPLNEADSWRYECVARGVDGKETSYVFPDTKTPCNEPMKTEYCYNGGSCFYKEYLKEYVCECGDGYKGPQCREKVNHPSTTPCEEPMKTDFCRNGGKCFYIESMKEYWCECVDGYKGGHCDEKESDQSSMYRQTPIYTCKIGLYTKYDNC